MSSKTQSKNIPKVYNKIFYFFISVLIIILILNDLVLNKVLLNFRIILEIFFLPYIVLRFNLGTNLSKKRYELTKTGLNLLWSIVTIFIGVLGFLESFFSISLFSIEGNVATILSFVIGIALILSIVKYFYYESNFNKYKEYIKYFSFVVIGLNLIIIILIIFSNIMNISNINFGNSTSGVFILDIIVTLAILGALSYFLFIVFRYESNFNKYKEYIKYFSFVLIGLDLIIIMLIIFSNIMIIFSNIMNISIINFGNSTSGVFILDIIIVTLAILGILSYFLFIVFRGIDKDDIFNKFLKNTVPVWFILSLLIILFFQLFIIYLLNSNINLGRDLFQDTVKNSIFTGSIYLLLGIGLTMVYKLLNFANFAHGELIIFGSYVSITALEGVNFGFLPNLSLFILVAFISSAVISIISDFFVFRPLRKKEAEPFTLMIASIGLSLVLRFTLTSIYGNSSYGVVIPDAPLLNVVKYVVILMAIVFVILLELLLKKTKIGKAMRAMADNPKLAQVSGISPTLIIILVWVIGSGLAGIGGLFRLISNAALVPSFGFSLILPTFAVVILGGIGSYRGAIVAGYIVGFAENFGTFILIFFRQIKESFILEIPIILGDFSVSNFLIKPSFSQEYQISIGFIILVLVLLVKPTGIMGEEKVRER